MLKQPPTLIEDDTEEAPWMVMGSPQFWATTRFADSLRTELRRRGSSLYVAGMLPIFYRPIPGERVQILSPDVFVAPVHDHPRSSYDLEEEGVGPAFVLEVISAESRSRDVRAKPPHYEWMGVREYVLFAPQSAEGKQLLHPSLQGSRLDPVGSGFTEWIPDDHGRLYSEVLELWLVERQGELRLQRPDGSWVPTIEEESRAREAETRAREAETRAREEETRAREVEMRARQAAEKRAEEAEAELARLREELRRRENP